MIAEAPNDDWLFDDMYATGRDLVQLITEVKASGQDPSRGAALLRKLLKMVQAHLEGWQPRHRPN